MSKLEAFPGQGGKKYNSPTPERDLLEETIAGHERLRQINPRFKPDFLFGNSYGLYAALVVGGVIGFKVGLELAQRRADLVRKAEAEREARGEERTGMLSILGPTPDRLEEFAREFGVRISNYNGPAAHVLTGVLSRLKEIEQGATARLGHYRAVILPIEGAYHDAVRRAESTIYAQHLKSIEFHDPEVPLISSTRPRVLRTKEGIFEELVKQMVEPVELTEAVQLWLQNGVDLVVESGPGSTIKKLSQKIVGDKARVLSLEEDEEEIKKLGGQ